jgi:hypothetical protein
MTAKDTGWKAKMELTQNESKLLLQELNQKVDYIIEMLREEELCYPYHQLFTEYQANANRDH